MLLASKDAGNFMNRVALATGAADPEPASPRPAKKTKPDAQPDAPPAQETGPADAPPPKGRSHIRQARPKPAPDLPRSGPMADMLKRLFHKD